MSELRECPFCGNPPKLLGEFAGCGCIDERISDDQFDLVKSDWNSRPIEDDLRSKLAIAVEALEKITHCQWSEDDSFVRIADEALRKIRP